MGTVIRGDGVGRKLGYPTANLDTPQWDIGLPKGVYAVQVLVKEEWCNGAMTIQEDPWKVEVHVLDFGANLYGEELEVDVIEKVSDWEHIDNPTALKEKIYKDIALIRELFDDA